MIAATVKGIKSPRIAEIGAGYGRVANAYLRSLPGQYFIFDIPPALCVSQWYLERTLGPNHVFRFRPFDRFEDVKDEISRASAICLTTNQIQKFPDSFFNSVVSISTLPEMRDDQVEFYLSEMQRVAAKSIFLKQWKTWKNPVDGTDLTISLTGSGPIGGFQWIEQIPLSRVFSTEFGQSVRKRRHC